MAFLFRVCIFGLWLTLSSVAYANDSLRVSYDEQAIKLSSRPFDETTPPSLTDEDSVAARTQIVTIEAGSDSAQSVEEAFALAADVADSMRVSAQENTLLVRITDGRYSAYPSAYDLLRRRLKPSAQREHVLSSEQAERLTALQKAHNAAHGVGEYFKTNVSRSQVGLAVIRFANGMGAATTTVIVSEGWPAPLRLASVLMAAAPTGIISASFTLFSNAYSQIIIKPWIFSRAVSLARDQAFVQSLLAQLKARAPFASKLRLNIPLYLDQYVKGLFLEFPFLMISGLSLKATTTGFVNLTTAINSPLALAFEVSQQVVSNVGDVMMNVFSGIFHAAGGQLLFDQSFAITADHLSMKVKAAFGEDSAETRKRLAKIQFGRDAFMVANSIFQVWVAIFAVQGHEWAHDALKFYLVAGLMTRALVIPIENQNVASDLPPQTCRAAVGE